MSAITITKDNYQAEVQSASQAVLLDFWAPWCGPCRMLSPMVEQLADELGEQVKVGKVNVDDEWELARQFSVSSIPTLVVLKDGQVVDYSVGVQSKRAILAMLGV